MCDQCIHKSVCGKCRATGGNVRECAHFKEQRRGRWIKRGNEKKCSYCGFIYYSNNDEWNGCPNCLADMRGTLEAKLVPGDCHVAVAPRNDTEDGRGAEDG